MWRSHLGRRSGSGLSQRLLEPEGAPAPARCAPGSGPHQFDQMAADRQPEPRAAAGAWRAGLLEGQEIFSCVPARCPRRLSHLEAQPARRAPEQQERSVDARDAQAHGAAFGDFTALPAGQQIWRSRFSSARRTPAAAARPKNVMPVLLHRRRRKIPATPPGRLADAPLGYSSTSGLDLGQFEDIVDQAEQVPPALVDGAQAVCRTALSPGLPLQDLGEPRIPFTGCAVMAHIGPGTRSWPVAASLLRRHAGHASVRQLAIQQPGVSLDPAGAPASPSSSAPGQEQRASGSNHQVAHRVGRPRCAAPPGRRSRPRCCCSLARRRCSSPEPTGVGHAAAAAVRLDPAVVQPQHPVA